LAQAKQFKEMSMANWQKWGSFPQWISAGAAVVVGYLVYDLNNATYRISEVTAQQAFLNRSITLLNDYFYKLYDPAILRGGRCIAYMNAIPDDVFAKYIRREGSPLFDMQIVNIGEVINQIDALRLNAQKNAEIKKELYDHFDLCLELHKDDAFSVQGASVSDRAEKIKQDLPQRYAAFGTRYVASLDYREHALMMWYDDATYEEKHPNMESRKKYEQERKWRIREIEFIKELFTKNVCFPARYIQLLRKIKRTNSEFYKKVIVDGGLFPRLDRFDSEVCSKLNT
jgi:hypothetical protein